MTIKAYYGTHRGGSGCRVIKDATEAEKILRGGYGVTTVRLENDGGVVVGARERCDYLDGRLKWFWYFERDAFDNP
jgi:hypothetical protein